MKCRQTDWQLNEHISCSLSWMWAESCKNQLSDSWRTLASMWLNLLAWQRLLKRRCVSFCNLIKETPTISSEFSDFMVIWNENSAEPLWNGGFGPCYLCRNYSEHMSPNIQYKSLRAAGPRWIFMWVQA